MPTVTKAYGDESYIFDGKFIKVIIPFDKSGFTNTIQEIDNTTQKTTQGNEGTTQKTPQERLIELLKANPNLSRSDLATLLKLSEDGVKYQIKKLKDKGIIKREGPDKGGYWEVIE